APEGDDVTDLSQPEPEPPRAGDEREQRQDFAVKDPVPGRRPGCRRNDPGRLVQAERLPGDAAPGKHLSDPQTCSGHDMSLNPAPGGQVKGLSANTPTKLSTR